MIENIKLLSNLTSMASHAAQRHSVIAENIANADTPGYKAKDLQPFSQVFKSAEMSGRDVRDMPMKVLEMEGGQAAGPNGNNVSLEQQMMHATENKGQHEMALAIYRKSLDMMKMTVGKNL